MRVIKFSVTYKHRNADSLAIAEQFNRWASEDQRSLDEAKREFSTIPADVVKLYGLELRKENWIFDDDGHGTLLTFVPVAI
jgi:hypothetical protein